MINLKQRSPFQKPQLGVNILAVQRTSGVTRTLY